MELNMYDKTYIRCGKMGRFVDIRISQARLNIFGCPILPY